MNDSEFTQLRARARALVAEFNAVERAREAGRIPYAEALTRCKAISREMQAVTDRMRTLMTDEGHTPTRNVD